jgi:hypothetical protein
MPTFIKTGFWEKAKKGYKDWLNLDEWFSTKDTRPYKVYIAVLKQVAINPPTASILENTLGIIPSYTRSQAGQYVISGITPTLYSTNKLFIQIQGGLVNSISNEIGSGPDEGKIQILNYDETGSLTDFGANPVYIEIRVYN